MSVRTTFPVALLALSLLASRAECQTPAEVVKKAIEATGGAELLKKYPAGKSSGKGTIEVMGMNVEFTSESTTEIPGKSRSFLTLDVMGMKVTVNQVVNGKKCKVTIKANNMDLPAPPLSDAVKAEMQESTYVEGLTQLINLSDAKKYKLETIEKPDALDGDEVNGVLVKSDGHKDVKLYFSKKSSLLVGMERQGLDTSEKEVTELTKVSGYKKIDGIMHPTKVEVLHDGKPFLTAEETEMKHLEKVDPTEFDISD